MRNNLMAGYSAAVKILKSFILAGLEAARFAVYLLDGRYPLYDSYALVSQLATPFGHWPLGQKAICSGLYGVQSKRNGTTGPSHGEILLRVISEASQFLLKSQFKVAGRAVSLLTEDNFGNISVFF
jgi:hypothetical protein